MEDAYKLWQEQPTPDNMGKLLEAASPNIDSAIRSYGGGNPALRSRARRIAIDAFKTYDPKKGAKLSSHLMTQLQPLQRHAREYSQLVKVPERVSLDLYKLKQAEQTHMDTKGREASDKELADHTGFSMRRIAKLRNFKKGEVAESGLTEMDEGESAVMYPGVQQLDPSMIAMEYVHHDLMPIDQMILEWKTGYNGKPILSNNEIAKRLSLSAGAISQRSAKIAARLAEGEEVV
jgi:DNA-directed RNA polymerase specialized sigma subunit